MSLEAKATLVAKQGIKKELKNDSDPLYSLKKDLVPKLVDSFDFLNILI